MRGGPEKPAPLFLVFSRFILGYVSFTIVQEGKGGSRLKKAILAVLVCLALFCGVESVRASQKAAVTPPPGSPVRKAILAPLRAFLKENLQVEAVFVVRWLKVKDGWAWVETDPQSKDGREKYEPFLALVKKKQECWTIVEIPPLEEDSPPVDDAYFKRLLKAHPGLPRDVFPWKQ